MQAEPCRISSSYIDMLHKLSSSQEVDRGLRRHTDLDLIVRLSLFADANIFWLLTQGACTGTQIQKKLRYYQDLDPA